MIVTQRVLTRSIYSGRVIALDARGWCLGVVDDGRGVADAKAYEFPWLCTTWHPELYVAERTEPYQGEVRWLPQRYGNK